MRILRGLTSRVLPCGCLAGIYETYDGQIVSIVDERGDGCPHADHQDGKPLPDQDPVNAPDSTDASGRRR